MNYTTDFNQRANPEDPTVVRCSLCVDENGTTHFTKYFGGEPVRDTTQSLQTAAQQIFTA